VIYFLGRFFLPILTPRMIPRQGFRNGGITLEYTGRRPAVATGVDVVDVHVRDPVVDGHATAVAAHAAMVNKAEGRPKGINAGDSQANAHGDGGRGVTGVTIGIVGNEGRLLNANGSIDRGR
jgi:hypothetical protein